MLCGSFVTMACPQVVVGGNGLGIWSVAGNISNKQSWTASKGWSFSLGVGHGDNKTPCYKK
jgi:hypothetical protein